MNNKHYHLPVMVDQILSFIPKDVSLIIDGTLGDGGHTLKILENRKNCHIFGMDQDPQMLNRAKHRLQDYQGRVSFVLDNFSNLYTHMEQNQWIKQVDVILLDLGVASFHFDEAQRGFSFTDEHSLDMRLSPDITTSAKEIINQFSESELMQIFRSYGEERYAGKIARAIVQRRKNKEIQSGIELEQLCQQVLGGLYRRSKAKINPATRVFQGLRIYINREIAVLKQVLKDGISILKSGGVFLVIAYHSLEDREVKQYFKMESQDCLCDPKGPICTCNHKRKIEILTKKPIESSKEEVQINPRARSAKLRVARRI